MKTYQTVRYKCDFCKKRGGRKSAMERHERGCTANPNRVCLLCDLVGIESPPIEERFAIVRTGTLADLRSACGDCPACMLASIRQFPDSGPFDSRMDQFFAFDAKAEFDSWWREYNREQAYEHMAMCGPVDVDWMRYDV